MAASTLIVTAGFGSGSFNLGTKTCDDKIEIYVNQSRQQSENTKLINTNTFSINYCGIAFNKIPLTCIMLHTRSMSLHHEHFFLILKSVQRLCATDASK